MLSSGTSVQPITAMSKRNISSVLSISNGARPGRSGPDNWFKSASQRDGEAAQRNLNTLFPNGIAVEKDLDAAISVDDGGGPQLEKRKPRPFWAKCTAAGLGSRKIISLPVTGIYWRQSKAMRRHSSDWETSTIRDLALTSTIRLALIGTKRLPIKATPGRGSRSLHAISPAVAGRPIERRRHGYLSKRQSRVKRVACTRLHSCT